MGFLVDYRPSPRTCNRTLGLVASSKGRKLLEPRQISLRWALAFLTAVVTGCSSYSATTIVNVIDDAGVGGGGTSNTAGSSASGGSGRGGNNAGGLASTGGSSGTKDR